MAQISELNKKTLASYIKKASSNRVLQNSVANSNLRLGNKDKAAKIFRINDKRLNGIYTAADKLSREPGNADLRPPRLKKSDYNITKEEFINEVAPFDKGTVTIHSPGHPFHGKVAHVFHRFDDGSVNAQVRYGDHNVHNFTLKPGQYKQNNNEEVGITGDDDLSQNKKVDAKVKRQQDSDVKAYQKQGKGTITKEDHAPPYHSLIGSIAQSHNRGFEEDQYDEEGEPTKGLRPDFKTIQDRRLAIAHNGLQLTRRGVSSPAGTYDSNAGYTVPALKRAATKLTHEQTEVSEMNGISSGEKHPISNEKGVYTVNGGGPRFTPRFKSLHKRGIEKDRVKAHGDQFNIRSEQTEVSEMAPGEKEPISNERGVYSVRKEPDVNPRFKSNKKRGLEDEPVKAKGDEFSLNAEETRFVDLAETKQAADFKNQLDSVLSQKVGLTLEAAKYAIASRLFEDEEADDGDEYLPNDEEGLSNDDYEVQDDPGSEEEGPEGEPEGAPEGNENDDRIHSLGGDSPTNPDAARVTQGKGVPNSGIQDEEYGWDGMSINEKIGHIQAGAFHRWLGKPAGAAITDADIRKGLAAGGHAAKMANFARNARHFNHKHR